MIKEQIVFDDEFVVALTEETGILKGRNVVGFDSNGNLVWRIIADPINPKFGYVSIIKRNGILVATNFSTNQIELDYKTGKVLSSKWVK